MAKSNFTFFVIFAYLVTTVWCHRSHTHHLRKFNSGQDSFPEGSSTNNEESTLKKQECVYPAADAVENAEVVCDQDRCHVQCHGGYTMKGNRTLYLNCNHVTNIMTYDGHPWEESLPPCVASCENDCTGDTMCVAPNKCEPVVHECDPPCQNGGTCIIQDVCNCSLGYSGLLCQEHRCAIPAVFPRQASVGADTKLTRMSIVCNFGHKMKNGLAHEFFLCNHHQWYTKMKNEALSDVDIDCYE